MPLARSPLKPRFDASGICLLQSRHAGDFQMPWTREPFAKVIAPLRGSGQVRERAGGRTRMARIAPGLLLYVEPGADHRISDAAGDPLDLYILCLAPDFPFLERRTSGGRVRAVSGSSAIRQVLDALREIAAADAESPDGRLLRGGLAAAVAGRLCGAPLLRAGSPEPAGARERVADLVRRLETQAALAGSIDDAARETGLSRRRFTQLFLDEAREPYHARVERLRIRRAQHLLREGRPPIIAAFECGYEDLSTFYRAFRRQTKTSPTKWARMAGP